MQEAEDLAPGKISSFGSGLPTATCKHPNTHFHPRTSLWRTIPVLPAFRTATAVAVAAATADGTPTAAVAAVLVRGHRGGQALQLPFTLRDFQDRCRLTSLHLNSKVHLPFSGERNHLQRALGGTFPVSFSVAFFFFTLNVISDRG